MALLVLRMDPGRPRPELYAAHYETAWSQWGNAVAQRRRMMQKRGNRGGAFNVHSFGLPEVPCPPKLNGGAEVPAITSMYHPIPSHLTQVGQRNARGRRRRQKAVTQASKVRYPSLPSIGTQFHGSSLSLAASHYADLFFLAVSTPRRDKTLTPTGKEQWIGLLGHSHTRAYLTKHNRLTLTHTNQVKKMIKIKQNMELFSFKTK